MLLLIMLIIGSTAHRTVKFKLKWDLANCHNTGRRGGRGGMNTKNDEHTQSITISSGADENLTSVCVHSDARLYAR